MNTAIAFWHTHNMGGICFCIAAVLFFPAVGTIGYFLNPHRKPRPISVEPNFSQPVKLSPPVKNYTPGTADELRAVASLDRRKLRSDPTAATPKHVHILAAERSDVSVTDIGAVVATCIVAGCGESVYIAPGLVSAAPATN